VLVEVVTVFSVVDGTSVVDTPGVFVVDAPGMSVVDTAGADDEGVGAVTVPKMQYCCPATSVGQLTLGFRASKSATVMPQSAATEEHVSPLVATTGKVHTTSRKLRREAAAPLPSAVRTNKEKRLQRVVEAIVLPVPMANQIQFSRGSSGWRNCDECHDQQR
jgi:hypothetical protein